MKKTAIIVDFDPKLKHKMESNNYDIFILDRLNNNIANIETSEQNMFKEAFSQEMTFEEFYKTIAKDYKDIFCLFLSYDYSNINDYLLTADINKNKKHNEAKVYTYLLNYILKRGINITSIHRNISQHY